MTINKTKSIDLPGIEIMLKTTLKPVTPRSEFVKNLRQRLLDPDRLAVRIPQINTRHSLILSLAGIAGGTLFLVTGLRAVLSLIGALGVIVLLKRQGQTKGITSPRLV